MLLLVQPVIFAVLVFGFVAPAALIGCKPFALIAVLISLTTMRCCSVSGEEEQRIEVNCVLFIDARFVVCFEQLSKISSCNRAIQK